MPWRSWAQKNLYRLECLMTCSCIYWKNKEKKTNLIFSIIYSWRWRIAVAENDTRRPANWYVHYVFGVHLRFHANDNNCIIIKVCAEYTMNVNAVRPLYMHRALIFKWKTPANRREKCERSRTCAVKVSDGNLPELWSVLFFGVVVFHLLPSSPFSVGGHFMCG